ncbi:hypothetical protein [Ochrobactrum teleogrylli]|uniref:Uncharacterized protein n=1 Tax=Ochrobactrum teleogrylli TaxID=2479765 RepID=A0ABD5JQ22_9HYPH
MLPATSNAVHVAAKERFNVGMEWPLMFVSMRDRNGSALQRPEIDIGRGLAKKSALKTLLCLFV